jgi:integrase
MSNRAKASRLFQRPDRPGFWYARVRINGRDKRVSLGRDKRVAREALEKLLHERNQAKRLGIRPTREVSFKAIKRDFWTYLRTQHKPTTLSAEKPRLEHIANHFGSTALCDVDAGAVGDFVTALRRAGQSKASTNRYKSLLSVMFKWAVDRDFARTNPVTGTGRLKEPERAVPYLSEGDVQRLVSACRDADYASFIRVLSDTGLRRSEALALQWRDVDLARRSLTVRASKTDQPRNVPLTGAVVAAVAALAERQGIAALRGPDPVWPALAAIEPASVTCRFRSVSKRAGFMGLRLHDLRHGFASRLTQAGVPLPTVARLCGHKAIATTMRYAKHAPGGAERAAIDALDRAAESPKPTLQPAPKPAPSSQAAGADARKIAS